MSEWTKTIEGWESPVNTLVIYEFSAMGTTNTCVFYNGCRMTTLTREILPTNAKHVYLSSNNGFYAVGENAQLLFFHLCERIAMGKDMDLAVAEEAAHEYDLTVTFRPQQYKELTKEQLLEQYGIKVKE